MRKSWLLKDTESPKTSEKKKQQQQKKPLQSEDSQLSRPEKRKHDFYKHLDTVRVILRDATSVLLTSYLVTSRTSSF